MSSKPSRVLSIGLISFAGTGCSLSGTIFDAEDKTPPNLSIQSSSPAVVLTPFTISIFATKDILDLDAPALQARNASIEEVTRQSPREFTALVKPIADGQVVVTLFNDQVRDLKSNKGVGQASLERVFDTEPPSVVLSAAAPAFFNFAPMQVIATFSEEVKELRRTDLIVTNGIASGLRGGPLVYTFDILPSGQGDVVVNLPIGAAMDLAGRQNEVASNDIVRVYDTVAPVCSFTLRPAALSNDTDPAYGFACSDDRSLAAVECRIDGAAFGACTSPTSLVIANATNGAHTVEIRAIDAATNHSLLLSHSFTTDRVQPIPVLSSTSPNSLNGPFLVNVEFDKEVGGVDLADFTIVNGAASAFTMIDAKRFSFLVTPSADGAVTVQLPAARAKDDAGNDNAASNLLSRTADVTRPTVILTPSSAPFFNSAPLTVTASFSEPVTGFDLTALHVINGTAFALTGGPMIYSFNVTPSAEGAVAISLPAGATTDLLFNPSEASNTASSTYDVTPPTGSITGGPTGWINTTTATMAFNLADDRSLGHPQCRLDSGAWTACTSSNAHSLSGLGEGPHLFELRPVDSAGNLGAVLSRSFQVDSVPPAALLSSSSPDPLNTAFTFEVKFSKDVSGLLATDFTVTNGTIGGLTVIDDTLASVIVTPTANGVVTVQLPAGRVNDLAGNGNTPSNLLTRTYDTTRPSVTLASSASGSFNTSPITVTATFSKDVTDFTLADLSLTNAIASTLSGGPSVYTFAVTPSAQGAISVAVKDNAAMDAATNLSTASAPLDRIYDTTGPNCSITGGATGWITSTSASVTFSCVDNYGFASAQCRLDGGAWVPCSSSSSHILSGLSQGAHTLDVRGTDFAGNIGSSVARSFSVDSVAPSTPVVSGSVGSTAPSFTFSSSDATSGLASYQCQLDGAQSWTTCTSGKSYSGVGPGAQTFRVIAYDVAGNASAQGTYVWSNGGWGGFGGWYNITGCSASCGGGTYWQQSDRACNNPAPSNGGYGCSGSSYQQQQLSCNTQSCCSGTQLAGYCWHYGDFGASCDDVCASRGGVTAGTCGYANDLAGCESLRSAFGFMFAATTGPSGFFLGCYGDNTSIVLSTDGCNSFHAWAYGRRFCSCAN